MKQVSVISCKVEKLELTLNGRNAYILHILCPCLHKNMLHIGHHRHPTSCLLTVTFRRALIAPVTTVVLPLAHPRERNAAAIVAPELT
jgi:hypothetical protein